MSIRSGWRTYEEDKLIRVAVMTNRLLSYLPMFMTAEKNMKCLCLYNNLRGNSILYD